MLTHFFTFTPSFFFLSNRGNEVIVMCFELSYFHWRKWLHVYLFQTVYNSRCLPEEDFFLRPGSTVDVSLKRVKKQTKSRSLHWAFTATIEKMCHSENGSASGICPLEDNALLKERQWWMVFVKVTNRRTETRTL